MSSEENRILVSIHVFDTLRDHMYAQCPSSCLPVAESHSTGTHSTLPAPWLAEPKYQTYVY